MIGLAVPRALGEFTPLSNSGKMMVIIMNTDKDNLSVLIVGFKPSGTKGDLFRRPFGIYDTGRLNFVFVSSNSISDERAISDIKGPVDNFMEIIAIYNDFEQSGSNIRA